MSKSDEEITVYLRRTKTDSIQDKLYRLLERQLKVLAKSLLTTTDGDHTLQPTVLVDEAFVRLVSSGKTDWENRAHFYKVAHGTMRRVLIDHSRRKRPKNVDPERVPDRPDRRAHAPERNLEGHESMNAIAQAIEHLQRQHPDEADTFFLSFFHRLQKEAKGELAELAANYEGENLPIREVAQKRGKSITTTWRHLGTALDFLREELTSKEILPDH